MELINKLNTYMKFSHLHYFGLCLRKLPLFFARQPLFAWRLVWRRFLLSWLCRFVGDSFTSPTTGQLIFNRSSLISAFAFEGLGELDGEWINYIRETPAPVIIDVGSNIGSFRRYALSFNAGARVFTVDPWPAMKHYVPEENHYAVAVGANSKTLCLALASSGWTASTEPYTYDVEKRFTVESRTLDSIWQKLGSPYVHLLKIDVDGSEEAVIAGAEGMLRMCVKYLLVEVNSKATLERLLERFGPATTANHHDYLFDVSRPR